MDIKNHCSLIFLTFSRLLQSNRQRLFSSRHLIWGRFSFFSLLCFSQSLSMRSIPAFLLHFTKSGFWLCGSLRSLSILLSYNTPSFSIFVWFGRLVYLKIYCEI